MGLGFNRFAKIKLAEDGAILVTDLCHFREYYEDLEGTASILQDVRVHTGDMGYLNEQGRLHLFSQKKNMIHIDNGEKISCPNVDAEFSQLPDVEAAAVIYVNGLLIAVVPPQKKSAAEADILQSVATFDSHQPY